MLKGIGASGGIGFGRAYHAVLDAACPTFAAADPQTEEKHLENAVQAFDQQNREAAKRLDKSGADGDILRGHIALLHDPFLLPRIIEEIKKGASAKTAVERVCDLISAAFDGSDDEPTRQRAADLRDIKAQMLRLLTGGSGIELSNLPPDTILIADELTPSMTAGLDAAHLAGIVTEQGGETSHAAIIARALHIPAVLGVQGAMAVIPSGAELAVDGYDGAVYQNADEPLRERLFAKQKRAAAEQAADNRYRGKPTRTGDGEEKRVLANIGSPRDLNAVLQGDAEGIGLFRTELLFLERNAAPTEEEQLAAYRAVAAGMRGKEVVIRTLDVGGDKNIPYLGLKQEENPFMGFRAVRYCLQHPELYKTQLRAILRASAYGNVSVMVPLVTCVDEICRVRELIEAVKRELERENLPYRKDMRVGVMIETPAACLIADLLAEHADFFSIGTNDLTGYVMAADRGNADVSGLYSPFDPAVLRAIRYTITAARTKGIPCCVCGEAGADPHMLPLLLSFGLREWSVAPDRVLAVRRRLAELHRADCDAVAKQALSQHTAAEVIACLKKGGLSYA